jgi:hypothetical protein
MGRLSWRAASLLQTLAGIFPLLVYIDGAALTFDPLGSRNLTTRHAISQMNAQHRPKSPLA